MTTVPVNPLWGDGWDAARRQWDLDPGVRHFNHGSYGAVPRRVRQAQRDLHDEVDHNPSAFYRRALDERLDAARARVAEFCGADMAGVAWVRNASEGVGVALLSLGLGDADEIVVTDHRYPSVRLAVDRLCGRSGARQVEAVVPMTANAGNVVEAIVDRVRPRTRVVVVDAIAAPTCLIFPVAEIAQALRHRDDITVVVDAAHAPGMIDLDVEALGAGIWVGNFHKWTCAPQGSAALWAAPRHRDSLRPPTSGYRDLMEYPDRFGRLGTDDLSPYICTPVALDLLGEWDHERVRSHNRDLAAHGAALVRDALGTDAVEGTFGSRHPVALPPGVAATPETAVALQTAIALDLHTEVSVNPPIDGADHGNMTLSAFVYNHPDEYAAFAQELVAWLPGHLGRRPV